MSHWKLKYAHCQSKMCLLSNEWNITEQTIWLTLWKKHESICPLWIKHESMCPSWIKHEQVHHHHHLHHHPLVWQWQMSGVAVPSLTLASEARDVKHDQGMNGLPAVHGGLSCSHQLLSPGIRYPTKQDTCSQKTLIFITKFFLLFTLPFLFKTDRSGSTICCYLLTDDEKT